MKKTAKYRFLIAISVSLITLPFVAAQTQATAPKTDSGRFLYQSCQLRLKVLDDPSFKATPREAAHALMCDSYVQGFTDGMISSSHEYCPVAVTREQAIRKYAAFMTENPLFLNEDKLEGLALVLRQIYRCPQNKH